MSLKNFAISKEIKELIEEIDVSDTNYEKASGRYNSIAAYIKSSNLAKYNPDIYLQGSIKLGTAIRPLTKDGSYDIDIVCNFTKKKRSDQTQRELKSEIGEVIEQYSYEKGMKNIPEESNRCWTLNYVDESNFHIDILPSVPWDTYDDANIAISDKKNSNYENLSLDWEISNPKGYSEWFKEQSEFRLFKEEYEKRFYSNIEKIPDYKIKTPLQRIVQLLKRHAEVMFEHNIEFKPSSVIITTLVAKAYPNSMAISNNFEELLINVIKTMSNGIEYENNNPSIFNPVNGNEKLSLKWDKDNDYFKLFLKWIEQLHTDFNTGNMDLTLQERAFYIQRSLHRQKNEIGISLTSLEHHQKSKWTFSHITKINVEINTYYSWKSFRFKRIKSGEALNKNGDLRFEVKAENIKNYDVYWQVTNTGDEAKNANCLRGDFYDSKIEQGKRVRTETTSYIGRHYVEAYLVRNNICYGKSNPFEVNITTGVALGWFKG